MCKTCLNAMDDAKVSVDCLVQAACQQDVLKQVHLRLSSSLATKVVGRDLAAMLQSQWREALEHLIDDGGDHL